jgi:hypothetical protein
VINVNDLTAIRNAYELSVGLKPNVYRNRVVLEAACLVAERSSVRLELNPAPNRMVLRSYVVVDCNICGNTVLNGGWQFEHINDDGNGLAGDELAKAIVDGTEDVGKIQFGCGTCNAAKNAERAFRARLAKVGRDSFGAIVATATIGALTVGLIGATLASTVGSVKGESQMRYFVKFDSSDMVRPFAVTDTFGNVIARFRLKGQAWNFRNDKMGIAPRSHRMRNFLYGG